MGITSQQEVLSVSSTFEQILRSRGLAPGDVEFLRAVWAELGRANIAIGILLSNIRALEEVTGEKLEGEDAVLVDQIEKERKPYLTSTVGGH